MSAAHDEALASIAALRSEAAAARNAAVEMGRKMAQDFEWRQGLIAKLERKSAAADLLESALRAKAVGEGV